MDEHGLERTVNEWVRQGWTLDGVQFAMRESSKRPSMAFVFFTREATAEELVEPLPEPPTPAPEEHLARLSLAGPTHLVATTPRPDDEDAEQGELNSYREFDPAELDQDVGGEDSEQ